MNIKMKKAILSVLIVLVGYSPANAQDIIDTGAFNKVVDYLDCKLVEISINRSSKQNAIDNFKSNCNCDSEPGYTTIQNAISEDVKATRELSKQINSIKSKYRPTWKTENAIAYLKDTVFTNNESLKTFNGKYSNDESYKAVKQSIEEQVRKRIKPTQPPAEVKVQIPTTEGSTETATVPSGIFTLPVIILIVFVALLIIAVIVIIGKLNSNRVPEHIVYFVESKISKAIQGLTFNNNRTSSNENKNSNFLNKNIEDQIRLLEEKVAKLQLEVNSFQNRQIVKPSSSVVPDNRPNEEVFYLSTPNTDGSFDNSDVSQFYKDGASIYRFVKTLSNRASFYIEDKEDSINRALQYPDKRIDPVCEAQNAFNPKAKSIKTITPGEVELIGDKWVISFNKKAKIRYE